MRNTSQFKTKYVRSVLSTLFFRNEIFTKNAIKMKIFFVREIQQKQIIMRRHTGPRACANK